MTTATKAAADTDLMAVMRLILAKQQRILAILEPAMTGSSYEALLAAICAPLSAHGGTFTTRACFDRVDVLAMTPCETR